MYNWHKTKPKESPLYESTYLMNRQRKHQHHPLNILHIKNIGMSREKYHYLKTFFKLYKLFSSIKHNIIEKEKNKNKHLKI